MPRKSETDQDIVREAEERLERAQNYQSAAHAHYVADMKFAYGDDENGYQWEDGISAGRASTGRPSLTINKTRVHNLQVVNDARQNPAQIRINPVGDDATVEAAKIFEGIVRHIEYVSNAQQAYANATHCQVVGGIGYWRVLVDYVHDGSFDQDIFIRRIADPTSVYMDPDIIQADGSDARWAFLFYDLPRDAFEAEYGTDDELNLNDSALTVSTAVTSARRDWRKSDKYVEVVEYFRRVDQSDRLFETAEGRRYRDSELAEGWHDWNDKYGSPIVRSRDISEPKIEHYIIADSKIIERKEWLGQYIPIVRVPCEEVIVEGKLDWVSHTRHLRDPQRLYNWYSSQAAEFVALQTKTPYVAVAESVEPYKKDWESANVENKSILLYKGMNEQGQPIQPPVRQPPPSMAPGYIEGLKIAQAEMMMASGQYQAIMGEPSNETSGKAINARQRQGDNATYHVIDRLASAIRFTGRILIDLIPKIYTTERTIMILAEDGTPDQVDIRPNMPVAHQTTMDPAAPPAQPDMNAQTDPDAQRAAVQRTLFNPNVGRYAVISDVGPAYATRRQEAFNAMNQVIASNPAFAPVVGDIWAKNADFPGADELAARLKQGLPPQYKAGAPDPQVMQLQAQLQHMSQQGQQMMQQADAEIASLKGEVVRLKEQAQEKTADMAIKDYEAETNRLKAVGAIDPNAMQVVTRQMLREMLQTELPGLLQHHGDMEMALQGNIQAAAPPEPAPANGGNGAAASRGTA